MAKIDSSLHLTPMTFGWANGKVYIFGRGQKIINLRRDETATVLVDTGDAWNELNGIMMRGSAQILETGRGSRSRTPISDAESRRKTQSHQRWRTCSLHRNGVRQQQAVDRIQSAGDGFLE